MKHLRLLPDHSFWLLLVVLFVLINPAGLTRAAGEQNTTQDDQLAIAISLYQNDLAFIRDIRRISLDDGRTHLVWQQVSANIKPETAWLRHLTRPEQFEVITKSFDLQPLTPQKLLESYTGKSITVIDTNPATGEEIRETATVLSTQGGVVLQFADRIETGVPGRLAFPELPDNLREKPAMLAFVDNSAADNDNQHDLQLAYLTQGLSWQADYILELDQQARVASLTGLATLTNQSGIDYQNARIKLIAGQVNQDRRMKIPAAQRRHQVAESFNAAQVKLEKTPHFELHHYRLHNPVTLLDDQSKQVTFMSAHTFPVEKVFILQGQRHYYSNYAPPPPEQSQSADVYVKFHNTEEQNPELGTPLPAGVVRAYQHDRLDNPHFVGEDTIVHIPAKAWVQLKLGQAFDITAEKKQTDFKRIPTDDTSARHFESAHRIKISNAKKEAVTVIVREPIPGDWTLLAASQSHNKIASDMAEWRINIPAESSTVLTYRVRVVL